MSLSNDIRELHPWYGRLLEPMYRIKDAARYSGARSAAVSWWLRRGDPEWWDRSPGLPLSYLELVDVAFATYFRRMGIPFDSIREARSHVAKRFRSNHPFAEISFKTDGHRILMEVSSREIQPNEIAGTVEYVPIPSHRQVGPETPRTGIPSGVSSAPTVTEPDVWSNLIEKRASEFDYEFGLALTWHPVGRDSSVTIDPRMCFGDPAVDGVPTWVIKGRWEAGESLDILGDDYGLRNEAVEDALRFESVDIDRGR